MVAWNEAAELRNAALGKEIALSTFAERERKVRRDFWSKLKRFAGMVPFVEDLVAAYYCALDPATPMRVRGMMRGINRVSTTAFSSSDWKCCIALAVSISPKNSAHSQPARF